MPRDKNVLPQTIFTRKYPKVNFPQTTVYIVHINYYLDFIFMSLYKL